jgi:ATP-binding cassette subfamily F protein uup
VAEYVGGYEDWVRQRKAPVTTAGVARPNPNTSMPATGAAPKAKTAARPAKLTYKEQRELEALPKQIEALETEERELAARVAAPGFYKEGSEAIAAALARQQSITGDLAKAIARWEQLASRS